MFLTVSGLTIHTQAVLHPITNRICYYAYFTIAFEPLLITYEHNNLPRTDGCIL